MSPMSPMSPISPEKYETHKLEMKAYKHCCVSDMRPVPGISSSGPASYPALVNPHVGRPTQSWMKTNMDSKIPGLRTGFPMSTSNGSLPQFSKHSPKATAHALPLGSSVRLLRQLPGNHSHRGHYRWRLSGSLSYFRPEASYRNLYIDIYGGLPVEAEEVEELVVQVQVGTYIQWVHNFFNKRGLPCIPVFHLQIFSWPRVRPHRQLDIASLSLSLSLSQSLSEQPCSGPGRKQGT